jgi:hypothetical protein
MMRYSYGTLMGHLKIKNPQIGYFLTKLHRQLMPRFVDLSMRDKRVFE